MPERPATRTPATAAELRGALLASAPELSTHQQALLLAHIAIENAKGKSIIQHNVGNFYVPKARQAALPFWRPSWFAPPGPGASARIRRLHDAMLSGKEPSAFRAFDSLDAGMANYMRGLRGKFSPMLAASTAADFVQAWKDTGYTPALNVEKTTPVFTQKF